jgi:hypothetical protein
MAILFLPSNQILAMGFVSIMQQHFSLEQLNKSKLLALTISNIVTLNNISSNIC